jgi:tryptophan synthase beta chain
MSIATNAALPDAGGHFGQYGGMFVPETLMTALRELEIGRASCRERVFNPV